jgi:hypothetical protein
MAKLWQKGLPSFDMPTCFLKQGSEDILRREVLFTMARRRDVISYYELHNLPGDEVIAMAIEDEDVAKKEHKISGAPLMGQTADECYPYPSDFVYAISADLEAPLSKLNIIHVSEFGYLVDLHHLKEQRNIVLPTRMVFRNEEVAEFMRRELIAYRLAPSVRR